MGHQDREDLLPAFSPEQLCGAARAAGSRASRIHTGLDQEDAAQEFALGALVAESRAEPGRPVRSLQWVYGRGFMLRFSQLSRRWREREARLLDRGSDEDLGADVNRALPAECAEAEDQRAFLRDQVKRLPAKLRQVIQARYFEGKTHSAIAETMSVSRERIRQLELEALGKLRR